MSSAEIGANLERLLFVTRVIVGSLIVGVLMFAIVLWFVVDRAEAEPGNEVFLMACGLILVAGLGLSWVLGRVLVARYRGLAVKDDAALARGFLETTVARAASVELPAFAFLIAYMLTGSRLALAGAAVALLAMLALFPTRAAFERFRAGVLAGSGSGGFDPR